MTLEDYNEQILTPTIVRRVENGNLDKVLFDPDIEDITLSPAVKAAIDARKAVLRSLDHGQPTGDPQ